MSQRNLLETIAFARASYLHALDSFTPPPGERH
jgi:dihydroorotate dehydrogenase (fumarate)